MEGLHARIGKVYTFVTACCCVPGRFDAFLRRATYLRRGQVKSPATWCTGVVELCSQEGLRLILSLVINRDDCNTQVTGHTATAVLGSQMILLGGGNKRQFHSCRHVPMYDPIDRTWSKLSTRGNAPVALIYHRYVHDGSFAPLLFLAWCYVHGCFLGEE